VSGSVAHITRDGKQFGRGRPEGLLRSEG